MPTIIQASHGGKNCANHFAAPTAMSATPSVAIAIPAMIMEAVLTNFFE
jgi:hypothetical protein